jgi:putative ABC transport system ATP-binding protein
VSTLEVDDLCVEFVSGGYPVRPLNHVSFSAEAGQLVVLLGPSGCGKTTMLSCLAGLLTPTSGAIRYRGEDVTKLAGAAVSSYRRSTVGVVFQAFNLIPSLTARQNVTIPLRLAGVKRAAAGSRADRLLDLVGLSERSHHRPGQLSGGQQQRVAIARALVQDPPLVVADEPTAHLDYIQVEGILRLIRSIASGARLVVVATHDERITQLADNVVELTPHRPDFAREPVDVGLPAGEILFRMGDPSDLVYVVSSGEVELYREREGAEDEVVAVVGPGTYFGELGPLLDLPRTASARAISDCSLVGYSVQLFRSLGSPAAQRGPVTRSMRRDRPAGEAAATRRPAGEGLPHEETARGTSPG